MKPERLVAEVGHPAVLQFQFALDEPAHRARVEHMLGRQHAPRERGLVVAGQHRHHRLRDDRPVVQFGADEMHRGAGHLATGIDRPAMRVQPRERRQQRRMDVEHPARVARHELRRQDAHEAGQHDQVRRMAVDRLGQRRVECRAVRESLVVEHLGGDAVGLGGHQSTGVGAVADHRNHTAGPVLRLGRAHDRVKVRALTRDQDRYSFHGPSL